MTAPSFNEFMDIGKAEMILRRSGLQVRPGDISEMLDAIAAAMADRVVGWQAERIAATFLDGASGDDLTQLAADHWSIQRQGAAASTATVTFTRSAANATAQTIPTGTTVATERDSQGNDVQFVTISDASWAASTNGDRVVNVQAAVAGVAGNLATANSITRIISSPPAGGTYTITASSLPAGGADEESDESLRDRVRLYPSTLRRGTLPALEYGAKQTSGISVAKASAIQDSAGILSVYVSDASGNSSGVPTVVGPNTVDVGTMTSKVAVELFNWAAGGAVVYVVGGATQLVNITISLAVRLGVDVAQLTADIQSSVSARVNRLNIGETLYRSDIVNAVKAVDPDNIVNVTIVSPSTDVVPTLSGNLIRPGVISLV